ncbi:hypothetical protein [Cohnella fermenti]|uniref:Uncharacterized protein n=1 Tax=Cohnella fermenti TaxID=2565925 RepID=A0A4S4BEW4_9BACL|nr:hypothetical protein [Cohnella fermenti]THF72758.1 hypothetical protein E6C55_31875 [Cohnella fermenti]
MDMQSLQASFRDQDQAEEAVRKLASLRANRFRMERTGGGADFGSRLPAKTAEANAGMSRLSAELLGDSRLEAASELGTSASSGGPEFHLTVDVPAGAAEQARKVIRAAGGHCR